MTPILRYGLDASVTIETHSAALLGQCGSPDVEPVADVQAEVRRALTEPLDYPPFSAIITPGDRVAIAISDEVPAADAVVAAVVQCLVEGRVDPEAITVLHSFDAAEGDPCRLLPESIREQVTSVCHVPGQSEALAYLATTNEGEAVVLHRAIVDADLVVPIGCFRGHKAAGYHGIHTPVYPTFSDRATLARFRSTATLDPRGRRRKRLAHEADEVGWLLGVSFTLQVIPAGADTVGCVLAGKVDSVRHRAMELCSKLWNDRVSSRARVVLAALEGGPAHQTWDNLGRAIETAMAMVQEGGGLALCTELADRPGAAITCLRQARSREEALQQIYREEADDAVAAIQLARALDHCSVYLMSELDDTLVEDLEMTPIEDAAEVVRLAERSESFMLLGNAAYAQVTVEDECDG